MTESCQHFCKKLPLSYLTGFLYMPLQLLQYVITAHTNIGTYFSIQLQSLVVLLIKDEITYRR